MANNLHLIIKERDRGMVYESDVDFVSAINAAGPFDIMVDHAQFISLIERSIKITHTDGRVEEYPLQNGVLKVFRNTISVYIGIKKDNLRA